MRIHVSRLVPLMTAAALLAACGGGERAAQDGTDTVADGQPPAECPTGPVQADVAVTIQGDSVEVQPRVVRVAQGGDITWESAHPFMIFVQEHPDRGLPTDRALIPRGKAKGSGPGKGKGKGVGKVKPNAPCGEYGYKMAVYDSATGQMLPLDPPIMVVPGG